MHTSTLVTSICTLSLKAFCRFMKHEGNALNLARSTLLLICLQFLKFKSIQKSATFIWMVKMHTSALVTIICTLSLKVFCRIIKYNEMRSKTLPRHFSKSVQSLKIVNQYRKVQTFISMVKMHISTLTT